MSWKKLGLIFRPDPALPWSRSHAAAPTVLKRADGTARVYYAARDDRNRSHVGWFDTDLNCPGRILRRADKPALSPGPLGTFDDHGVYASSVIEHESKIWMYTIGWNPGKEPPLFYSSIGLAVSHDGGTTFDRYSPAPIMARSEYDPCLVTSPVVLKDDDRWRMWYVSGFKWEQHPKLHSLYDIKYASSKDGINWSRNGLICLATQQDERNIARFCVASLSKSEYVAWYSANSGAGYKLGCAASSNGLTWERRPVPLELSASSQSWEADAMAYPWFVKHDNTEQLFYNGNSFGKDGIGLAVRYL